MNIKNVMSVYVRSHDYLIFITNRVVYNFDFVI